MGPATTQQLPPPAVSALPQDVQRYVRSGQPMNTVRRDLSTALNQVPPLVWGGVALLAFGMARRSHRLSNKPKKREGAES